MLRKLLLPALFIAFIASQAMAQTGGVTGTVTNEEGEPVPTANVLLIEINRGAATNLQGEYIIDDVQPGTYTLRVTFVGYQDFSQQVTIEAGQTLEKNITLQRGAVGLEELVVTGLGGATIKEKSPISIAQVNDAALEMAPAVSVGGSLTGKVAGLTVTPTSGAPGSGMSFILRGAGSLQGTNQPLFIVDGIILAADVVDLEPQDIKSIEVVKGAAAASLYGSRAQNGIINITTYRGASLDRGQTVITVRNEFGINMLQQLVPVNQSHWFRVNDQGEWLGINGNVVGFDDAANDLFNNTPIAFADNPYPGKTYNNIERFYDPGTFYRNYVSVANNIENLNYFVSFSNTHESGVIEGIKGYGRKSVRLNIDHDISQALDISLSSNYVTSERNSVSVAGVPNPFFGLLFQYPNMDLTFDGDDEDNLPDVQLTNRIIEENPLYGIRSDASETIYRSRILAGINARFQPVAWFNLEANFSYDHLQTKDIDYLPLGFKSIDAGTETGLYSRFNSDNEAINASLTASFIQSFGDLFTHTRFRVLIEEQAYEQTSAVGNKFIVGGVKSLDATDPASQEVGSYQSLIRSRGFFALTNLDYKDRYILNLMIRRDGSSLFGARERWQTYYRVSAAYRISQEDWWFAPELINEFKIRYSLGTAGARPDFSAQYQTFNVGVGSITKGTLGNPDLKPEFSTSQAFGVDMGILNRVWIQLTYASTTIDDQILLVPLPSYYGYSSQWQNAGTVENQTFEGAINATVLQSQDMSLTMGATFSTTEQTITALGVPAYRAGPDNYPAFYIRAGETFGAMYGTKWMTSYSQLPSSLQDNRDAFDINDDGYLVYVGAGNSYQDGISEKLWGTTGTVDGQTYNWGMPIADVLPDGSTFQQIGSVVPDFSLGFVTNFNYKGFGMYMVWSGQIGGDVYNATKQWPYRDKLHGDIDQSGKPAGKKKPIQYYGVLYNTNGVNSHFVEDGTFVKLRELSIEYSLSRTLLNDIFGGDVVRDITFGIVGRNLLTFTGYSGYDPEVLTEEGYRIDNFDYPVYRTFTAKLELKF